MYLINTTLVVNWILEATDTPLALGDLDIYITPPNGDIEYLNGAIAIEDYVIPTVDTNGTVSYTLTVNELGLWAIALSDGEDNANTLYLEYKIKVTINDTSIKKFVRGDLL